MPNLRSIYDSASRESVGGLLLRRLRELGVTHVFGVAGDYNLELLEQLEGTDSLEWVGCCNEPNAAYAAHGYALTRGLSALITTYGVGELSALCGVAGAYAEHVPVVSIVGAPPLCEMERRGLLHHTAGDGDYTILIDLPSALSPGKYVRVALALRMIGLSSENASASVKSRPRSSRSPIVRK